MDETRFIPISAIQHFRYCARQCALIHIDGLWAENQYTAEGTLLHRHVDTPGSRFNPRPMDTESNPSDVEFVMQSQDKARKRTFHAMPLVSYQYGITGKADSVEIILNKHGKITAPPRPVEHKRGKPKRDNTDAVQLCAQAICLEEMTGWKITQADLFYHSTRQRIAIEIDQPLRIITCRLIDEIREMIELNQTPRPIYGPKCRQCSLRFQCLPKGTDRSKNPHLYLTRAVPVSLSNRDFS
jgi:CRISPR-associated exonuclease Cas4